MTTAWNWAGSRWWKFDFHTHTPASIEPKTQPWQEAIGTPEEVTPEKWLKKFMAAGIDCVAITDHNTSGWIDTLQSTYKNLSDQHDVIGGSDFRPLILFPGVEISVGGGIHLLAIFAPGTSGQVITSLLGACKFPANLHGRTDDQDTTPCTRESFQGVLAAIKEHGGLAIPAHAEGMKGLLQTDAQARPSTRHPDQIRIALEIGVDAIEITDCSVVLPQVFTARQPAIAQVIGTDCHSFRGTNAPGTKYTWVKMGAPTIDGLRLALHDGNGVSIRRYDDADNATFNPMQVPEQVVASIVIGKFRVMGAPTPVTVPCSPFFNAFIGGRGTGKSSIVHALRLAYRREDDLKELPSGSDARETFERFCQVSPGRQDQDGGALTTDSHITVTVLRAGTLYRLHWRKAGSGPTVEEADGAGWKLSPSQSTDATRFKIRMFSQGQIADLAGTNQQALLKILDEAAGVEPLRAQAKDAQLSFESLRAKMREIDGRLKKTEEVRVKLEDVQRKLQQLEGSNHAAILKQYQAAQQQRHEVDQLTSRTVELGREVASLVRRLTLDEKPDSALDQTIDADVLAALLTLRTAVDAARDSLTATGRSLTDAATNLQSSPGIGAWSARVAAATQAYEQLKTTLAAQGITDTSAYGRLVQERQTLQGEQKQLTDLEQQRQTLDQQATEQLTALTTARNAIRAARNTFLSQHLHQNRFVQINLIPSGEDIRSAERRLRELIDVTDERFAEDIFSTDGTTSRGMIAEWSRAADRVSAAQTVVTKLVAAAIGQGALGAKLRTNLQLRAEKDPGFPDRLCCLSFEDGLRVSYSPGGDGQGFRPIEQASAGQRAAAMLAFLLSYGDEPLVLDQPEDDLDNHLIYELVVQQIRANKLRRQLIVVTHNPNIVVNADAELIHVLDFIGDQCAVKISGAMQDKAIRIEVCKVMEGGANAFRKRWDRLGQQA